jgi:hypothetical protein
MAEADLMLLVESFESVVRAPPGAAQMEDSFQLPAASTSLKEETKPVIQPTHPPIPTCQ